MRKLTFAHIEPTFASVDLLFVAKVNLAYCIQDQEIYD